MRDIHSGMSLAVLIGNAVLAADSVPASVDLLGFDAAEIILSLGAGGINFTNANKIEFVLTHSDDDVTYTPVATKHMLGVAVADGGIIKALTSVQANPAVYRFGYKGGKRFLKLLADFSGAHGTGTAIAATLLRMRAAVNPQADQA